MEDVCWRWYRAVSPTVHGEVLGFETLDIEEPYHPFDLPTLPTSLAHVQSADGVLAFAETYGPLGYAGLVPDEMRAGGDPVRWILVHAASVRFALGLIEALTRPSDGSLVRALAAEKVHAQLPESLASLATIDGAVWGTYMLAIGARREAVHHVTAPPTHRDRYSSVRVHAQQLIKNLVNANTKGVHESLIYRQGLLVPAFTARGLIEVIWWHVGKTALAAQQGGQAAIRICDECHTPFLVTDRRQKFCPPEFRYGKQKKAASACGSRHRKQKERRKGDDH